MAGTTVISYWDSGKVTFHQSEKSKDADSFICDIVSMHQFNVLALDAPLSLPGVYHRLPNKHDYFYRDCDRQLKAMSPMFIGGLTARAMKLKKQIEKTGAEVIEAYPKAIAKGLDYHHLYQKKNKGTLQNFVSLLVKQHSVELSNMPVNWHQVDSLLALLIASKYVDGRCDCAGDAKEGQIFY